MSVYRSVEMDAWSRNFDYAEYRAMHPGIAAGGAPLSRQGYEAICVVFEEEMSRSFDGTGDFNDPNCQG